MGILIILLLIGFGMVFVSDLEKVKKEKDKL